MRRDPAVEDVSWKDFRKKLRAAAVARFVLKCDDAATRLLHRATIYRKPMMITLKSGKVYIGEPVGGTGDPSVRPTSIKIIPKHSGVRNPNTHKVELRTNYTELSPLIRLRDNPEPSDPEDPLAKDIADLQMRSGETAVIDMQDMGIVILWSEIQTLSMFDKNIYETFQSFGAPEKEKRHTILDFLFGIFDR
jgi:hypothetical protein